MVPLSWDQLAASVPRGDSVNDAEQGLSTNGKPVYIEGIGTVQNQSGDFFVSGNPAIGAGQYGKLVKGADGSIGLQIGQTRNDGFWKSLGSFIGQDILPIAAWVATPYLIGTGVTSLLGAGSAGVGEAGAGWVSAEGGASYAGGLAADGVVDGAITYGTGTVAGGKSIWDTAGKFALDQAGKVATAAATSAATSAIKPNDDPLQGNPLPIDTPTTSTTASTPIDSQKQIMLALLAGAAALAFS